MSKTLMYDDPDLLHKRLTNGVRRIRIAAEELAEEHIAAVRSVRALERLATRDDTRDEAWSRIVTALAATGDETPEQIADMVEEETDATRAICGILDLPRETRPEALVKHVRWFKEKLDKLKLNARPA